MTSARFRPGRLLLLALLLSTAGAAAEAAGAPDPRAAAVVARMERALGGAGAPYSVDSIAFTFAVERDGKDVKGARRHVWHPRTGAHRVEGNTREGKPFVTEWNLHTRSGKASEGGVDLAGDALKSALELAEKFWVNDTFWLLMPYKLRDPGVHLAWDGEREADGKWYDVVKVTFDRVGLTPGDTYWAYVARDTGLMERWAFVLEGEKPPPVEFRWLKYGAYGPLVLSTRKEKVGAAQAILTNRIEVH